MLASLAGIIEVARLSSAQPTAGTGYELDAIAAVVKRLKGSNHYSGSQGSARQSACRQCVLCRPPGWCGDFAGGTGR
jgi:ribose/xylose/arabinose/galactoside ABC-type transport system permease subunit